MVERKKITFLTTKTMRPLLGYLKEHYGYEGKFEFALVITAKSKVYAVTKEVFDLPVETLRVNSFGVYIGEWRHEEFRLSIEGSQLIGPECTKNVVTLNKDQLKQWMAGEPLPLADNISGEGFVILKFGDDFGILKTVHFSIDHIEIDLEPSDFHIPEREGFQKTSLEKLQEYLANEWNK